MTHASPSLVDDRSLEAIPSLLLELEGALRAMSTATQDAAHTLVPAGRIDESAAERFARAAESWTQRSDGAPPTHERQAEILLAFDDARATLDAAAACCSRARQIVASTLHISREQP